MTRPSPPPPARAAGRSRRSRRPPRRRATASRARPRSNGCAAPTPGSPACASFDSNRRPWSRSSAAIVWRLFFTRWWISRIVASFDISIRSRRRRSVTSRMSTTTPVVRFCSTCGIARMRIDVSARSISSSTGSAGPHGPPDRALGEARSPRGCRPGGVRVDAEVVQQAHRVRAREHDPGVAVEDDHAVTHAWRRLRLDLVLAERERALGDHVREPLEDLRRRPARARPGAGSSSSPSRASSSATISPRCRTGMHWMRARSFAAEHRAVALDDLAESPGAGDERRLTSSTTVPTMSTG